jgi:hypothetical protein
MLSDPGEKCNSELRAGKRRGLCRSTSNLFAWGRGGKRGGVLADFEPVAGARAADRDGSAERGGELGRGEYCRFRAGGLRLSRAEKQDVGEERHDFLHVMRYQNERGCVPALGERGQECEEVFARDGVETRGGFIQEEHPQTGHQRAPDEHPLAFALGKISPGPLRKMARPHLTQDARGLLFFRGGHATPEIDLRTASGKDDIACRLLRFDLVPQAGADEPDRAAYLAPIVRAESGRANPNFAAGGHEVAGQGAEQRGLAGAVGAEDDPVLSALHPPVDFVEDDGFPLHAKLLDLENCLFFFHPCLILHSHFQRARVAGQFGVAGAFHRRVGDRAFDGARAFPIVERSHFGESQFLVRQGRGHAEHGAVSGHFDVPAGRINRTALRTAPGALFRDRETPGQKPLRCSVRVDPGPFRNGIERSRFIAHSVEHDFLVVFQLNAKPVPADLVRAERAGAEFVIEPALSGDRVVRVAEL